MNFLDHPDLKTKKAERQEGAVDWNAVSAIGGVLAAISVTLTVVYLAIQIRKNTHATHSQTYHLATSALAEMAGIIGSSKELARIFRIGMINPDKLDEDEFAQFGYLGISLFHRFENVFFQYQSGMIDEDFWTGHRDNILWFFHRPGSSNFRLHTDARPAALRLLAARR